MSLRQNLLFASALFLIAPASQASSECFARTQSFYKKRMEQLLNQQERGEIGGGEFEDTRAEIQYVYEGELSICRADSGPPASSIFDPPPSRAPASAPSAESPAYEDAGGFSQN